MKCGKTDLCTVREVRHTNINPYRYIKYHVTWQDKITPISVFSEKFKVLFDMMVNDAKSTEVGLSFTDNHVLWLSNMLIQTMSFDLFVDKIITSTINVSVNDQLVNGVVFDNMGDVETFANRLEQKYIWYTLKQ